MKALKHVIVATAIFAALATPGTAKSISDQIWGQVNQTMPHKPGADQFKQALPHRPSNDEFKDALPRRPNDEEFKEALP